VAFPLPYDAVSSGASPTGQIMNFGIPPLHNATASGVRIDSVELVNVPRSLKIVSATAYLSRKVGLGDLIGFIGDLPKTCQAKFAPHPVTDALPPLTRTRHGLSCSE
jgi:hypothetical protein